jgi:SAM-dependent methyltransferase
MDQADILEGYALHAQELIPQFEKLATPQVLAPVMELLPVRPGRVLDVGAGTGRDAAWLADRGHRVTAVEPVRELREAGAALHPSANISWMDDRLPALEGVRAIGETYDTILCIGVWQHVQPSRHQAAVAALAVLAAPRGRLILSLRHGPGSPHRRCYPVSPGDIISAAEAAGLGLRKRCSTPSIQQRNRDAGVTWTWLCLERR